MSTICLAAEEHCARNKAMQWCCLSIGEHHKPRTRGKLKKWYKCVFGTMALFCASGSEVYCAEPEPPGSVLMLASASHHEAAKGGAQISPATSPTYLRDVLPILMGKCARCHSAQSQVMPNWLDYHTAQAHRWEIKRRIWDSWKGKYFKQSMPTVNSPESEAITAEERITIRNWVESGASCGTRPSLNSLSSKPERIEAGKHLFATICASCHQPSGRGIPGRFPPLAGSDLLNTDKHRAIQIVVNGLQGEVTVNGQKFNNTMPRFPLSDDDIASALTFVYSSFGNSGQDVTPKEVGSVRAEKQGINGSSQTAKMPEEKNPYE